MPVSGFGISGQHSTFVMAGPGVREGMALERQVRVIDVAPTLCHLLGLPMPRDVEGGIIYEALEDPELHLLMMRTVLGHGRWLYRHQTHYQPGNWQVFGAKAQLAVGLSFPGLRESTRFFRENLLPGR